MKRKIKVWNRTLLIVAATILALTMIGASLHTASASTDDQIPQDKPTTTEPTTPDTEPATEQIELTTIEDWIQGDKQQTTYTDQKLKLAQHQTETPKERKELIKTPYRLNSVQDHIVLAAEGELHSYNTSLQKEDSYTFFERGFTSLQTKNNKIYATELIFEERSYNETLHIIEIDGKGELDHKLSQELDKDIGNFKPLNEDKFFITEHQNYTHLYEKDKDTLEQKETLELEADFYDQVIHTEDTKTYTVGQEFDQEQKTLIKINHEDMELENKTLVQDLDKNDFITGIQKLDKQEFVITTTDTVKIVEKDYAGNQTYKYKTQDSETFNTENLQLTSTKQQLSVSTDTETIEYNIQDKELKEEWSIQRPEQSPAAGITKVNENLYTTYRERGNTPPTIEKNQENYEAFRYYEEGTYTSQKFDLGSTQHINGGRMTLDDNNQDIRVTVEAADNRNFQNSEQQTVEPAGTLQTLSSLDLTGRYVKITLELEGNTWQTPEIEQVTLEAR